MTARAKLSEKSDTDTSEIAGEDRARSARRRLKLVAGNVFVMIFLLLFVNIISGITLRMLPTLRALWSSSDSRASLPNYSDASGAATVYSEFQETNVEYAPFVEWRRKPFAGETTTVGTDGDRLHAPPQGGGATSGPHIRFFGGSTMWGFGVSDDGTIPALFNEIRTDWRVYNHGEIGFNTRQNLDRLISLHNLGAPMDIVVFYVGVNDAATLCRSNAEVNGHGQDARMKTLLDPNANGEGSLASFLYRTFVGETAKLARGIAQYGSRDDSGVYACAGDKDRAREVADVTVSNLELAHDIVTSLGGRFIAILQPVAFVGSPKVDHVQKALNSRRNLGEDLRTVYPIMRDELAARASGWSHDATAAFDKDEYIYVDFAHVSRNGNRIIAQEIDRILKQS